MSEKPYKHALGVVDLLESTNYATWKRNCGRILQGIRAWSIVVGEEEEPNNPIGFTPAAVAERAVYNDYLQRQAQAAAIIYGSCSIMVKVHLDGINSPAEMWTILAARMDAASTAVGRMTLFRKFNTLRPTAGQPINTYFAQLLEIKNQLLGSAEAIHDVAFKTHIFTTLPSLFAVTVEILQSRVDLTIQELLDALKECEQNKAMITKPDAVSEALYSQQGGRGRGGHRGRGKYQGRQGRNRWCDSCNTSTHNTEYCWKKDNSSKRKRDSSDQEPCFYCGETGHWKAECPVKRKADMVRNSKGNEQGESGQKLLMNTPSNSE